eukprot:scaffold461240_cov15-Prasinocladus_malaysianus.AAC.1
MPRVNQVPFTTFTTHSPYSSTPGLTVTTDSVAHTQRSVWPQNKIIKLIDTLYLPVTAIRKAHACHDIQGWPG